MSTTTRITNRGIIWSHMLMIPAPFKRIPLSDEIKYLPGKIYVMERSQNGILLIGKINPDRIIFGKNPSAPAAKYACA